MLLFERKNVEIHTFGLDAFATLDIYYFLEYICCYGKKCCCSKKRVKRSEKNSEMPTNASILLQNGSLRQ